MFWTNSGPTTGDATVARTATHPGQGQVIYSARITKCSGHNVYIGSIYSALAINRIAEGFLHIYISGLSMRR